MASVVSDSATPIPNPVDTDIPPATADAPPPTDALPPPTEAADGAVTDTATVPEEDDDAVADAPTVPEEEDDDDASEGPPELEEHITYMSELGLGGGAAAAGDAAPTAVRLSLDLASALETIAGLRARVAEAEAEREAADAQAEEAERKLASTQLRHVASALLAKVHCNCSTIVRS